MTAGALDDGRQPRLPPRWSLRRRLRMLVAAAVSGAWLIGAVVSGAVFLRAEAVSRDARLEHLGKAIAAFAEHELAEIERDRTEGLAVGPIHVEVTPLDERYRYQIWSIAPRRLLMRSGNASTEPLVPSHEVGAAWSTAEAGRERTYVFRSTLNPIEVQLAESHGADLESWWPMLAGLAIIASMTLLAVAWVADFLLRRAVQPLAGHVVTHVERDVGSNRRAAAASLPVELDPLVAAVERLLAQAEDRLSSERGFTALAAHELRTPLAALRLQAQVAARETDETLRSRQLQALMASADRCSRLADQLLALARAESVQANGSMQVVDLQRLMDALRGELEPLARRLGVRISSELGVRAVLGDELGLRMLFTNLLVNALQHGGDALHVCAHRQAERVVVDVDDNGPGIPEQLRQRALDRFTRLLPAAADGRPGPEGSGLGLAIAQAVALRHGAALELSRSPLGGLRVRVSLRAAPGDSPVRGP